MVSCQAAATSPKPNRRETLVSELDNSSKKRKSDEVEPQNNGIFEKRSKPSTQNTRSIFEIELQLETPLPVEWQRCLDIQSGQIHFYNTTTKIRTSRDPRRGPEPPANPGQTSLDLELNLQPCESQRKNNINDDKFASSIQGFRDLFMDSSKEKRKNSEGGIKRCPSWLVEGNEEEEMVATVCNRCHMLVMLCKSAPTCPNCKFMHPPEQSPPTLFKQRLSLLC